MIDTVLQWLENSSLSVAISKSTWLYPIIEIAHITGIVFVVGPAIMFDLRLLGFSKNLRVSLLARHLLPWSQRGLLLIVPSGLLLFITNAVALWSHPVFLVKMLLLVVAGLNVFIFHRFTFRSFVNSDATIPTASAKVTASISIIVWLAIIACGRLLAY